MLKAPARIDGANNIKRTAQAFIDGGASLNAITPELVQQLNLTITTVENNPVRLNLGNNQSTEFPRQLVTTTIYMEGFAPYKEIFLVMPVPEGCDILLGLPWLRTTNPDINWNNLTLKNREINDAKILTMQQIPRAQRALKICGKRFRQSGITGDNRILKYYMMHGHHGTLGKTEIISKKQFDKMLRKEKTLNVFMLKVNPDKDSEKAARYRAQDWEALKESSPPELYNMLHSFKDSVFVDEMPQKTPPDRGDHGEHEILLESDTPINIPQYRQSPEAKDEIRRWTDEMVKAKIIRKSRSPYCFPTLCVRKPNGWRIVHDYRRLNAITKISAFPIPRKDDIFDSMQGAYWFSTMDLMHGYFQVRLKESNIPFTAFATPDGLYEYLVCPQGLSGAPATFNRIVRCLFEDYLEFCQTYFDDLYVFTKDQDINTHIEALRKILQRCADKELYIKISKCQFLKEEIPCLGDFVGRNGVRMDPDKINLIKTWPVPTTKIQMRRFLGTTVYVSKFCDKYSHFASSLHESIKGLRDKDKVQLNDLQLSAFNELKTRLASPPVLALPNNSKPFCIRMDASDFAVGGALFQGEGELERPVAFSGRKMSSAELNYPVREKELLAIMHALKVWRVYLIDKPFQVETDHKSLEGVLTQHHSTRRIIRWIQDLSEFQPEFRYIPGETNTVADAISRLPQFEEKQTIGLKEILEAVKERHVVASITEASIDERLKLAYKTDSIASSLLKAWEKKEEPTTKNSKYYSLQDGLIYYKTPHDDKARRYVPDNEDLKNDIIYENHDVPTAGHVGRFRTYYKIRQEYHWHHMEKYIARYIQTCEQCQRNKSRANKAPGLLNPLDIPDARWQDITMDFVVGLPTTTQEKKNAIMVIVDRLTKRAIFIPTKTTDKAEDTAKHFFNRYVRDHGIPTSIVSDRDSLFTSKLWSSLMDLCETQHKFSSAFRPQTDGQTEIVNKFLKTFLTHYVDKLQKNWIDYLPLAEFSYNSKYHSSIKMTPFEADIGYQPRSPFQLQTQTTNKETDKFMDKQKAILKQVQDSIAEAQEKMQFYYNRNRKTQTFQVGDLVLVHTENFDVRHTGAAESMKIAPTWMGPYRILEIASESKDAYILNIDEKTRLCRKFHTSALKPYHQAQRRNNVAKTVLLKDGVSEGYLVERIIGHRRKRGQDEYHVRWLGYSQEHDTWEPKDNLLQVPQLIDDFWTSKRRTKRTQRPSLKGGNVTDPTVKTPNVK